ncbi:MAG TPA: hypothetical protein VE689_06040 [Candidatus Udaeobacter sp.]|jgi:hypothetical protein|nr:hypothetical protein [Candidatus Udaeobacter sp.]
MKAIKTMTILKRSLAMAAIVAMTGTASAKNAPSGGVPGDLSPDRTSATVTVTAQCDSATQGVSGALSVYIFQPSGRLLNVGIANETVTCTAPAIAQDIVVTVIAVPGLAFKPGPATLLIRLTTTDQLTTKPIVSESGSRIDLHP